MDSLSHSQLGDSSWRQLELAKLALKRVGGITLGDNQTLADGIKQMREDFEKELAATIVTVGRAIRAYVGSPDEEDSDQSPTP